MMHLYPTAEVSTMPDTIIRLLYPIAQQSQKPHTTINNTVTENNLRWTFKKVIEWHRCTGKTMFLKYLEGVCRQWNILAILFVLRLYGYAIEILDFLKYKFIYFNLRLLTLQYCSGFCRTLTWIRHRCICVPHPEPPSLFPPHAIPLGHPSAPAPSTLSHASNLDWWPISCMVIYMFQCHSPKSSYPRPLPQSPHLEEFGRVMLPTDLAN